MYLASNYKLFQENKNRFTNVFKKYLGQINKLKHLPKNHQVYMKMIDIVIHPQVVEPFPMNMKVRIRLIVRK